jgi:hypothetical protein
METSVKWVKFYTSNVAEYQTLHLTPNDDGKKTLQDDGQTHDFTNAEDAVAKSTVEVYIFWDNVPVSIGSQSA